MRSAYDPINELTVAELDSGCRLLKTDIVGAITNETMHKWHALAIVAFLIARRTDPGARVETYRAMTINELTGALGLADELADAQAAAADDDEVDDADPTLLSPADERQAALDGAVAANPTVPTPVP